MLARLDLWSVVVGIILAMFVYPWLMSLYYRNRGGNAATTA